jgi:hypothetical protein
MNMVTAIDHLLNHHVVMLHLARGRYLSRDDYQRLRYVNKLAWRHLPPIDGYFLFEKYRLTHPEATVQEFINFILPKIIEMHNDSTRVWAPCVILPPGNFNTIAIPDIPLVLMGSPKNGKGNDPQKAKSPFQIVKSLSTSVKSVKIYPFVDRSTGNMAKLTNLFLRAPLIKTKENIEQPLVVKSLVIRGPIDCGISIDAEHPVCLERVLILNAQKTAIKSTHERSHITLTDSVVFGEVNIGNSQISSSNCKFKRPGRRLPILRHVPNLYWKIKH